MTITPRRWWWLRASREFPRYLLCALSLVGLLAAARFAIAPPKPAVATPARPPAPADRAAEGYAVLFARRYLSWNAAAPDVSGHLLEPFLGASSEANAGLVLPSSGAQNVAWAEVVQTRDRAPGEHVYTIAAQTDAAGLVYLSVAVTRTAGGGLALVGYPAFVGPPTAGPALPTPHLPEVTDPTLLTVVQRALRNYLAASPGELAADLTGGARISLPSIALSLDSIQRLGWSTQGRSVAVVLQAQDRRGTRYTLAYELEVVRAQGRWEISAVQMDPDT